MTEDDALSGKNIVLFLQTVIMRNLYSSEKQVQLMRKQLFKKVAFCEFVQSVILIPQKMNLKKTVVL